MQNYENGHIQSLRVIDIERDAGLQSLSSARFHASPPTKAC